MHTRIALATALCLFFFICGCRPSDSPLIERKQYLMGTVFAVSISGAPAEKAHRAADLAFQEVRRLEQIMSTYIPESDISRVNRMAGKEYVPVHPELLRVIREALRYSDLSGGSFDISYKPLSRLWHFEPDSRPPDPEEVRKVLPLVGYKSILIDDQGKVLLEHPGMSIDLGGIAKGYAVDRAVEVLEREGIANAIVNGGGDLRVLGRRSRERPWRVGVQDPRKEDAFLDVIAVREGALATSGDYEKYFIFDGVRYHHILDPKTGFPSRGCRSVTIVSPTAMMADAMATAVFLLGPVDGMELIQRLPELEGMIVTDAGEIVASAGFQRRDTDER